MLLISKQGENMIDPKYFMVAALLLAAARPVMADNLGLTQQFSDCVDESGGVTVAMLNCIAAETERQDARLNKAYQKLMSQLSAARKKELETVQRLWSQYRDAKCNFYADPDGGTSAVVRVNDCFMSTTAARAKELEDGY